MDAAFLNAQNTVTNLVHTIGTDAHITAGTDQFLLTQCTLSSRWFKQRCNALVLDEVHDECLDFHYNTALWHHRMTLPSSTLHCPVLALLTAQMTPDLMHDVGKRDKRIVFDTAVREHIQFCECNMKCTAYKYPWQMCFLWENNRASLPFGPIGMPPLCRAPVLQDAADFTELDRQENVFDVHYKQLLCRLQKIEWDAMQDSQRNAALAERHRMVMSDPMFLRSAYVISTWSFLVSTKGACKMIPRKNLHARAFPVFEEVVYSFMQHEEDKVRLPFVAVTANGVSSEFWSHAWKSVLAEAGVQVGHGKPLLPVRTPDGWIRFIGQLKKQPVGCVAFGRLVRFSKTPGRNCLEPIHASPLACRGWRNGEALQTCAG